MLRLKEFGEKFLEILLKGKDINTDVLGEIHASLFEKLEDVIWMKITT